MADRATAATTTGPLAGVPYDGADPKWQDLYHWPAAPDDTAWYSTDPRWHQQWFARIKDLVDQYQPDLLYSDGALPFGEVGRSLLAHYYNAQHRRTPGQTRGGLLSQGLAHADPVTATTSRASACRTSSAAGCPRIKPAPWQTDTSIGDWFYNKNWKAKDTGTMYRSPKWVIHTLVDVVSKNGNMLLNVIQRPDGSLDPEVEQLLAEVAAWMKVNSEAIHDTRPWLVYGEGATQVEAGHFKEDFAFSAQDIRFTQSKDGKNLYAIALGWPADGQIKIRALAAGKREVKRVALLGHRGKLAWKQTAEGLEIALPAKAPCQHAVVFEIK